MKRWSERKIHGTFLFTLSALFCLGGCGNSPPVTALHQQLPEAYIWFGPGSLDSASPRYFRKTFNLNAVPAASTLYVAGPYNWEVFVNGINVSQLGLGGPVLVHDRPVVALDVSSALRAGTNVVAIKASASDVLASKLVPAPQGVDVPAAMISDETWKASLTSSAGWEQPGFDDAAWDDATSLGSIESDPQYFRGNFDLNMYHWPGYEGMSARLDHMFIRPMSVTAQSGGTLLLDFGKEISGRLQVMSSSPAPISLALSFGESKEEATPLASFLGSKTLLVPALSTADGPLTAFRFVQIASSDASPFQSLLTFQADRTFRDIPQLGTFSSSDDLLNQIWQASVSTAQLGMQETFWDAPKRDRNPFAGDLFVAGRTTQIAFGNQPIVPNTLTELLGRVCNAGALNLVCADINGIPSYNAWWIIDLADWYRFSGDASYLKSNHDNLVSLLTLMSSETTEGLFDPAKIGQETIFADWSPGMVQFGSVHSPDAIKITTFAYVMAFEKGSYLLGQLGDSAGATQWQEKALEVMNAAIAAYSDGFSFGSRVQTNAMAIFSGVANSAMTASIAANILSNPSNEPVSPYFSYFVISALAQAGRREDALALIRQQWGEMLQTGSTTFWEVYDPVCPGDPNFHSCLTGFVNGIDNQGTDRLFVSLAHAWSSGPAPWLQQEILGIRVNGPGFKSIEIRPDLSGLQWMQGTAPTPKGLISLSVSAGGEQADVHVPNGIDAYISLPTRNAFVDVNNRRTKGNLVENGTRSRIHLGHGDFALRVL